MNHSILKVGDQSPDFTLTTEKGEQWRMSDQFGKVTALIFYPKNETLVCTKQLCSLRDHWSEYLQTKAAIVAVSPDSPEENSQFSEHHQLPLPILADPGRRVTGLFGAHRFFPVSFTRAIVVVDANGFIRHREVMLRVFRPPDRSVITSIYAARADSISDNFKRLSEAATENIHRTLSD